MPVRVLIADDHPLIRSGLRTLLEREGEFEVIGEAADGYEAIELATALKPDTAQHISQRIPRTRILLVSMHSDEAYILRALKSGARGYLLKASPELDVLRAVRAVAAGNAYFSPEVTKLLVEDYVRQLQQRGATDSYDLLSIREKEILQLLVSGKSNREIADLLHISVSTVETHRTNILTKLGLHNLPELILYAVRKGLLS